MMTDFLIAYWLHSTALLAAAWCLMKIARPGSSVVRERLWKLAAVLPVLTALTSVGFRSAQAIPVAERQATIVESPTASVPRPSGSGQLRPLADGRGTAQHHMDGHVMLDVPVAAEVFDVEPQAAEPVDAQNVVESGSTVELVDQFFEPVIRFENLNDESPSEAHIALEEAQQRSLVDDVPVAQASAATVRDAAWQPVWAFVSQALMSWVAISVLWLLVRSMWFRSRLRKARRIDRGRAVDLLHELNVAAPLARFQFGWRATTNDTSIAHRAWLLGAGGVWDLAADDCVASELRGFTARGNASGVGSRVGAYRARGCVVAVDRASAHDGVGISAAEPDRSARVDCGGGMFVRLVGGGSGRRAADVGSVLDRVGGTSGNGSLAGGCARGSRIAVEPADSDRTTRGRSGRRSVGQAITTLAAERLGDRGGSSVSGDAAAPECSDRFPTVRRWRIRE